MIHIFLYFKLPVLFLTVREHTDYRIWRKVDIFVNYRERNLGQVTVQPQFPQWLRMLLWKLNEPRCENMPRVTWHCAEVVGQTSEEIHS